ncbi:MAG TPA: sulfite exporter TauE/SafE family protein [Candidatus Avidesulfovibrio excrementigallinarum]|nr:sulfite exporter TauE/SafE family protein [Candidatus Avidesulfovibrio excrementigallinarum]
MFNLVFFYCAIGAAVGLLADLFGDGGGTVIIPYLTWHGLAMLRAVGTSAVPGFPTALAGGLGYLVSGYGVPGLPSESLGYISLPALTGIAIVSALAAPLGVHLARRIPLRTLNTAFALLVFCMGIRMPAGTL